MSAFVLSHLHFHDIFGSVAFPGFSMSAQAVPTFSLKFSDEIDHMTLKSCLCRMP